MISTSITFNTPQRSPLTTFVQPGPTTPQLLLDLQQVPLLTQYFLPPSAVPNEEQTHPGEMNLLNPASTVKNLLTKSIQEIRDTSDQGIPRIGMVTMLRKSFRDFYTREHINIFNFLNRPVDACETLSAAHQIMKRFGRPDYNSNRVKIRDLCLDLSCNDMLNEINANFPDGNFEKWVEQTRYLIETWKAAVAGLTMAEKKLDVKLGIFNDTHKKATAVLNLPPNDAYDAMLQTTEMYLKQVFQDINLEETYTEYLYHLKKMVVTTDAMNLIRLFVNASSEPMCPVCMNDTVCFANVPCGHTFCQQCGQKQQITCYICRTSVKDRQKLFFA